MWKVYQPLNYFIGKQKINSPRVIQKNIFEKFVLCRIYIEITKQFTSSYPAFNNTEQILMKLRINEIEKQEKILASGRKN